MEYSQAPSSNRRPRGRQTATASLNPHEAADWTAPPQQRAPKIKRLLLQPGTGLVCKAQLMTNRTGGGSHQATHLNRPRKHAPFVSLYTMFLVMNVSSDWSIHQRLTGCPGLLPFPVIGPPSGARTALHWTGHLNRLPWTWRGSERVTEISSCMFTLSTHG